MRRIYVAPRETHAQHRELFSTRLTTHWVALCPTGLPEDVAEWKAKGSPVAISGEFASEGPQDVWESHPLVTVTPHPIWDGSTPLVAARTMPENFLNLKWGVHPVLETPAVASFATHTALVAPSGWVGSQDTSENVSTDGIDHLIDAGFGVAGTDTVIQLHSKLMVIHPAFKLRAFR